MINSLSKDSHITHSLPSVTNRKGSGVCLKKREIGVPANNSNIIMKKPAATSFSGFSNIYTSKSFKNFLEIATDNEPVFSAAFAVLLTCILRPASIMSLPGQKNKDDKKYAAAHSMASGIMGYMLSLILFSPLAAAIDKIAENPQEYLKEEAKHFSNKKAGNFKGTAKFKLASRLMKMGTEALIAVPRAIVTIALIPPILKYVFGWEKKSSGAKEKAVNAQDYASINFKSKKNQHKKVFQNFAGVK